MQAFVLVIGCTTISVALGFGFEWLSVVFLLWSLTMSLAIRAARPRWRD